MRKTVQRCYEIGELSVKELRDLEHDKIKNLVEVNKLSKIMDKHIRGRTDGDEAITDGVLTDFAFRILDNVFRSTPLSPIVSIQLSMKIDELLNHTKRLQPPSDQHLTYRTMFSLGMFHD